MGRTSVIALVCAALAVAGLAYLRDPPWILSMTSGMREWETDTSGTRFRWTGGHASFFVPSNAHTVQIPLRTTFAGAHDRPVTATITLDDRAVDRVVLSDPSWHASIVRLPPPAGRRARRIDIRVDRTRDDNRGAQIGEVQIRF
jgi:hypothetical protein